MPQFRTAQKKEHTWVSTWLGTNECWAPGQVLAKMCTRCTWTWPEVGAPGGLGATTYHTRYHPARTLDEGQSQAPGRSIVSCLVKLWEVLDIHLHSYLCARLLGDLMALKEESIKSRLSVFFVKATFPCLGCFWHSVVGTWWHFRSGT